MKKIFNVILFFTNFYCFIRLLLVIANVLTVSKAEKILLWACFIAFIFFLFEKARHQFEEMKLIKCCDELFYAFIDLYQHNIRLDDTVTEFIADINDIIDKGELKKYNKEHLLEMVEYLNNLLSTTVSS